jgi:hypothetical protein
VLHDFGGVLAGVFYKEFPGIHTAADNTGKIEIWNMFKSVYTPNHGSWLNKAEIELHVLNGQCLSRHISTMQKIKDEVASWQDNRNNKNSKINRQLENRHACIKLRRLYPSLED